MSAENRADPSVPAGVDRMIHTDRYADTYDEDFAESGLLRYDHQLLAKWFDKPGRLLDLGCGTGRTLVEFGRRGFEVTGVDLSPQMLRKSRRKLEAAGLPDATLIEANIADLPMDELDPPYDYAICLFATLGFVKGRENRLRAVRQAGSLLRPGGQYVFHVQNFLYNLPTRHLPWILTGLATWAIGRGEIGDQVFWWYRGARWVTMHAFRPKEIRRLVADAGLELVEMVYLNDACDGLLERRRRRDRRSHGFLVRTRRGGGAE